MKKLVIVSLFTIILTSCGKPQQATVYGRSGAMYQAPSVCQAVVKCLLQNEQTCYYNEGENYQCRETKAPNKFIIN